MSTPNIKTVQLQQFTPDDSALRLQGLDIFRQIFETQGYGPGAYERALDHPGQLGILAVQRSSLSGTEPAAVGLAIVSANTSENCGTPYAQISFLGVVRPHRREGVGANLLWAVEAAARAKQKSTLVAEHIHSDTARRFFVGSGYRRLFTQYEMQKSLSAVQPKSSPASTPAPAVRRPRLQLLKQPL